MKIVCDCGNEDNLIIASDSWDSYDSKHATQEKRTFELSAGHDEIWITCKKCKKSIHLFA